MTRPSSGVYTRYLPWQIIHEIVQATAAKDGKDMMVVVEEPVSALFDPQAERELNLPWSDTAQNAQKMFEPCHVRQENPYVDRCTTPFGSAI